MPRERPSSPILRARNHNGGRRGDHFQCRRADVDDLLERYLACEFDEIKNGFVVGAPVAIVSGKFENRLATVTGLEKGGRRIGVKLRGHNVTFNTTRGAIRPAFGFDLDRNNPDEVPS